MLSYLVLKQMQIYFFLLFYFFEPLSLTLHLWLSNMAKVGTVWVRGLGGHPGVEQRISCSPAACFAGARGLENQAGGWLLREL